MGVIVNQEGCVIRVKINYQEKGDPGYTPYVGDNGNWWINGEDTGLPSRGGEGESPIITIENGIWFINGISTGQKAQGENGKEIELKKTATFIQWRYVGDTVWINLVSLDDIRGNEGLNAYEVAVQNGFVGTEQEWLNSLKGNDGVSIININPDSPTQQVRQWIGTEGQYTDQQPLPDDVLVFITDNND